MLWRAQNDPGNNGEECAPHFYRQKFEGKGHEILNLLVLPQDSRQGDQKQDKGKQRQKYGKSDRSGQSGAIMVQKSDKCAPKWAQYVAPQASPGQRFACFSHREPTILVHWVIRPALVARLRVEDVPKRKDREPKLPVL